MCRDDQAARLLSAMRHRSVIIPAQLSFRCNVSRAAALSSLAALAIIILRSYDRVISWRICHVPRRARTAGGSVTRHALDQPQNAGNRAGGRWYKDDDDIAIVGSRAYLIGPHCTISSFINWERVRSKWNFVGGLSLCSS